MKPQNMQHFSRTLLLRDIIGINELNPRVDDGGDLEGLCASLQASGQLQPLIVVENEDHQFTVLDGQRRWRAMCLLAERGALFPDYEVEVQVVAGNVPELIEIAVASNHFRRPLHPVDEYEAFVAMVNAGFNEVKIAQDFGLKIRHVKQRLALGRLAPKILDAWRKGEIAADIAEAFTAGGTHAAQETVFDELAQQDRLSDHIVRKMLRSDSLAGDAREAIYVGEEAYIARGGRIEDDLFLDEKIFLDGSLLKLMAREKLMLHADQLADQEGWGFVVLDDEKAKGTFLNVSLTYTEAEEQRLEEIERNIEQVDEAITQIEQDIFEIEAEEIQARAFLRQVPLVERARLGLVAKLDYNGKPQFERAWQAAEPAGEEISAPPCKQVKGAGKGAAVDPPTTAAPHASKDCSTIITQAIDNALQTTMRHEQHWLPAAQSLFEATSFFKPELIKAFDYIGYFEAATKEACLNCVAELALIGVDKGMKKQALARLVAEQAKDRSWLPKPLSEWRAFKETVPEDKKPKDERPLAVAMDEALSAADTELETRIKGLVDTTPATADFADFLLSSIRFDPSIKCKASTLRETYIAKTGDEAALSAAAIGKALKELGIKKQHREDGTYYQGIGLLSEANA